MLLLALLALLPATAAQADSITFWIASDHPDPVRLEFSSGDEPERYWPGNGLSYPLDDYEAAQLHAELPHRRAHLLRARGSRTAACAGASGYQQDRHCEDCCYECVGQETDLITLQPVATASCRLARQSSAISGRL